MPFEVLCALTEPPVLSTHHPCLPFLAADDSEPADELTAPTSPPFVANTGLCEDGSVSVLTDCDGHSRPGPNLIAEEDAVDGADEEGSRSTSPGSVIGILSCLVTTMVYSEPWKEIKKICCMRVESRQFSRVVTAAAHLRKSTSTSECL